jgi:hypothetical protein
MDGRFLLIAHNGSSAMIPASKVCEDYFSHLTPPQFMRKMNEGQLALPLVRMEASQKSAKGIHLQDLADYPYARRAEGHREFKKMYV